MNGGPELDGNLQLTSSILFMDGKGGEEGQTGFQGWGQGRVLPEHCLMTFPESRSRDMAPELRSLSVPQDHRQQLYKARHHGSGLPLQPLLNSQAPEEPREASPLYG